MTPDVQALLDLLQQGGMLLLVAWLYINEKRDHSQTRLRLESELTAVRAAHMADIREIAGMRQSLYSVPAASSVPRDRLQHREAGGISSPTPLAPEG